MKIKEIVSRNRRDFTAIYVCESCGWTYQGHGYDDANFHENVIPGMVCGSCGVISGKQSSTATVPAGVVL